MFHKKTEYFILKMNLSTDTLGIVYEYIGITCRMNHLSIMNLTYAQVVALKIGMNNAHCCKCLKKLKTFVLTDCCYKLICSKCFFMTNIFTYIIGRKCPYCKIIHSKYARFSCIPLNR